MFCIPVRDQPHKKSWLSGLQSLISSLQATATFTTVKIAFRPSSAVRRL